MHVDVGSETNRTVHNPNIPPPKKNGTMLLIMPTCSFMFVHYLANT